jgi:hypothetical protein
MSRAPKVHFSGRSFAASIKAILKDRQTNPCKRKRGASGDWIRDTIVVKRYCQMGSLREVLDRPARGRTCSEEDSAGAATRERAGRNNLAEGHCRGIKWKDEDCVVELSEEEYQLRKVKKREKGIHGEKRKSGEDMREISEEPPMKAKKESDATDADSTVVLNSPPNDTATDRDDHENTVRHADSAKQSDGYRPWPLFVDGVNREFSSITGQLIEAPS